MTITGRGWATACMRSNAPGSSMASSRSPKMLRIRDSRALTAFGVNALLTSARSRVWSGGSRSNIVNSRGGGSDACCRAVRVPLRGSLLKWRWLRRMASTSAWRVNSHAFNSRLRCTGSRARRVAYTG